MYEKINKQLTTKLDLFIMHSWKKRLNIDVYVWHKHPTNPHPVLYIRWKSICYVWLRISFQGDQLVDVFQLYPDIHVNFTVISLLNFNTSLKYSVRKDDGFNISLAHDALTVLNEALMQPFTDTDVESVRNQITSRIGQVVLIIILHFQTWPYIDVKKILQIKPSLFSHTLHTKLLIVTHTSPITY